MCVQMSPAWVHHGPSVEGLAVADTTATADGALPLRLHWRMAGPLKAVHIGACPPPPRPPRMLLTAPAS